MAAAEDQGAKRPPLRDRLTAWRDSVIGARGFQSWAARVPLIRGLARRDGERLFDLVSGFTYSQVLQAVVALGLLDHLRHGPRSTADLALRCSVPAERMQILCQAAAALGLLKRRRDGRFALARLGAALPAVPGLEAMILHHDVLYRDLADPVAFFRGETETELAGFWPYVFGAEGEVDPDVAATYSELMADSQVLVAEETLKAVDLSDVSTLLDVGGGTGAFLAAVGTAYPKLGLHLFDLPEVAQAATARFAQAGLSGRTHISAGDFRADPLPEEADAVSLVRVLYDHRDDTVAALLSRIHAALPGGGRILVSEPMSGGDRPERAGDAYFAIYCLAMRTGTVRSPARIARLLAEAGFADIETPRMHRPFITQVVQARKSETA